MYTYKCAECLFHTSFLKNVPKIEVGRPPYLRYMNFVLEHMVNQALRKWPCLVLHVGSRARVVQVILLVRMVKITTRNDVNTYVYVGEYSEIS